MKIYLCCEGQKFLKIFENDFWFFLKFLQNFVWNFVSLKKFLEILQPAYTITTRSNVATYNRLIFQHICQRSCPFWNIQISCLQCIKYIGTYFCIRLRFAIPKTTPTRVLACEIIQLNDKCFKSLIIISIILENTLLHVLKSTNTPILANVPFMRPILSSRQ